MGLLVKEKEGKPNTLIRRTIIKAVQEILRDP